MKNELHLEEFFKTEYSSYATYDIVRSIASFIDGQKNSSRKVVHTVQDCNINKFDKLSNLGPRVMAHSQYLHGLIDGIIVNMTKSYVGYQNNLPLMQGEGSFGTTFIPDAAATRYIYARKHGYFDDMFVADDTENLIKQEFEGHKIEPKFFVPTLPLILLNGNDAPSIGFAQKILPRSVDSIFNWVKNRAAGMETSNIDLKPHWSGQSFTVEAGDNVNQWIFKGKFTKNTSTKINITALPLGYTLNSYCKVLDDLVEKKVIRRYTDNSDDDLFNFVISVDKGFTSLSKSDIISKLKLSKTLTENFTTVNEDNTIRRFDTVEDMLEAWYSVKLQYNQKRIDKMLSNISDKIKSESIKMKFIKMVVAGELVLNNRAEADIEVDMSDELKPWSNVLLSLPIRSFTAEMISKLDKSIVKLTEKKEEVLGWTSQIVLLQDLKKLNDNKHFKLKREA